MRTLTLELTDEVYEIVKRTAQAQNQPPSAWLAARVPMLLPARKPRPVLTPEERVGNGAIEPSYRIRQHRRPGLWQQ